MTTVAENAKIVELVEKRMLMLLENAPTGKELRDAMAYSISAGGKRLRPLLNIFANDLLGGDIQETLDIACAIEMIHTYSLIHDDLPAMDNDELRRGKPTSHVMFGEAMAILAGDGLLNFAYEVMLQNALRHTDNLLAHTKAISEVARGAGVGGMIEGQCKDLENEGQIVTERELVSVHKHKTGDIIKASLLSGLLLCNPSEKQKEAISTYGYNIGLAFQVIDDILDVTGDQQKLGKTPGKDSREKKFTFVTLYGIEKSRMIAKEKTEEAISALDVFGQRASKLVVLASEMLKRDY